MGSHLVLQEFRSTSAGLPVETGSFAVYGPLLFALRSETTEIKDDDDEIKERGCPKIKVMILGRLI